MPSTRSARSIPGQWIDILWVKPLNGTMAKASAIVSDAEGKRSSQEPKISNYPYCENFAGLKN
jgi:hypothetical protein